MSEKKDSALLACSFCGKGRFEVPERIAGPSACICNECVELSVDILVERRIVDATAGVERTWDYSHLKALVSSGHLPRTKEIFMIQTHRRGQTSWHGAFSTKWKALAHMNVLGIAGDYLLGRDVWLMAYPLDADDELLPAHSSALGRLREMLVNSLKLVLTKRQEQSSRKKEVP